MSERYYKVLDGGRSRHDGDHAYPLPTRREDGTWAPGEWTPVEEPRLCVRGYHLTREPARWWSPGAECYAVEWDGAVDGGDGVVIAVERCRLLRPLTTEELAKLRVYQAGTHEVHDAWCVAAGSARVRAYGTASVWALDTARVLAYDTASVTAHDMASVTVYNSARVVAHDTARVVAFDTAGVLAHSSVRVWAYDTARVVARGSASVEAFGSAHVTAHNSTIVRAYGSAHVRALDAANVEWMSGAAC